MDNKINDLFNDIDGNLDVTNIYTKININLRPLENNSTNDLKIDLNDINNIGNTFPKVLKSKTKNFDSVIKEKRLKDIDLSVKISFLKKIKLGLKGRVSLTGIPFSVFKERVFFTKNFFRNMGIIFLIIGLLLFIDKYIVENKINSGYEKILSIKDNSGNIDFIKKNINDAKLDFIIGDLLFKPFLLIPNKNIENGYNALLGGKNLTKLIDKSVQIYTGIKKLIDIKGGIENVQLTNLLENLRYDFSLITSLLYNTIVTYDRIDQLSSVALNEKLLYAKNKLKEGYKFLDIINRDFDIFLNLLGNDSERKYLILFQNNDEIRPTGGFIGSLATITIKDGKVIDFVDDDVYAYEWEINKIYQDKKPAPEGLNKITETFGLRDANYFIDFDSSSESINFFLNKIGKKVDGIIYINQNTILDFLKYTGGIEFDKIDEIITEENFSLIISTLVEAQTFKVGTLGTAKQILFDFANIFIGELKERKDYFAYLDILQKNIRSRDLVIYSFNPEENNLLWRLGLNGKINYSDSLDFSYPVFTSVGGNKSDRYIELKYKKEIEKNADCSIDTNLRIFRTHFFSKFEEKKVNDLLDKHPLNNKTRTDVINIQGKGENKAYVRVVLPKEAIIEEKEGMNINTYEQTQVVDFYINTRLLETTNYDINYTIPNNECEPYDFKFYKQPGIRDYYFEIREGDNFIRELGVKGDYLYK
ncbi:MAG: DUF4012 domain-containing protein [Candidatus Gracilibacteria bacterium]